MASGEAELKEMIASTAKLMGNVGKDGNGASFSNKCRTDATQYTSCAAVHIHLACGKKPMH